tara:strand:- start:241 stop:825 length:585 start_codon:yes stop_codon:yes gene_type:complete
MQDILHEWRIFLAESSLSRFYSHMKEYDTAIISAYRAENTAKENKEKGQILKARLLKRGYGVAKLVGSFIENFETPEAVEVTEESLLVVNKHNKPNFFKSIENFGIEYEQDSVLLIPRGASDAFLVGTRPDNEYPPFGETMDVGGIKMGEESEFMSRVKGRPFHFKEAAEIEYYENFSRNKRWAISRLLEDIEK